VFAYSLRRLIQTIPILILATAIAFFSVAISAGDPRDALRAGCPTCDQAAYDRLADLYDLDTPLPLRYVNWLGDVVTGDLGTSTSQGERPVGEIFWERLNNTLLMAIPAFFLMAFLALLLSVYQALRQYSFGDYALTGVTYFGLSMPTFFFGLLLQSIVIWVNNTFGWKFFWTQGLHDESLTQLFASLTLPVITLILILVAGESRFGRTAMLEIKNSDYVRTARAKGLGERRVVFRHMLRNALIPLVTIWALDFAALLSGSVITESVFSWPGLGRLLIDGIFAGDLDVVMAVVTALAVLAAVFNLLADLLYGIMDPRIRLD
jgi:peptide/nickel transport system permease protein